MAKHNDKGKLLEEIILEFHSSENLKVEKNVFFTPLNENKKKREIDVLITANISGYISYIAIECKNNKKIIGSPDIESFYGKLEHLGLLRHQSVFISTKGFTSGAKESAKSKQIKLLVLEGLTKDGMAKEIFDAIFSTIYLFPIVRSWSIVSSKNYEDEDFFLFYNENAEYKCSLGDLVLENWKKNKELKIGEYNYFCENVNELYQKENNILNSPVQSITAELYVIALVFTQRLKANQNYLINEENKIEKFKLNMHSDNVNDDFILFDSEEELNKYLNEQKENIKIRTERLKISKIKFDKGFYPPDEELIRNVANMNLDFSKKENINMAKKLIEKEGNTLNIFNQKIKLVNNDNYSNKSQDLGNYH